ncbi:MAG: glycerophosphodiester phosphodiesterase family protein [Candidatus Marinimicrobia bacterium]|jgi:glycerophosphoryl diester phosphodiesterase|nr:glycerophosphodiester phosphodiesterase family protein [Candidatus Neomarinimicrobiota bacterium]MDP7025931.1 glycerophosphodiester phosphodiesterase family protein [Candidatus Neomarinimicrobiota bacterium]|tara:strand:- start:1879 stop:2718 length:840 start_codon:yes stop_codon:yes gene_type:complete
MIIFFILLALFIAIIAKHVFFWRPLDVTRLYANGPLLMGHRGSPKARPENTSLSFNHAVESGLSAVEIDVIATRDGRIVCSHNHDLERETDGFGYVHEMGYDDLRRIDAGIKYLKFSPTPIPLLEEVIDELPGDTFLNIEVKTAKPFGLRTADLLVKLIREKNFQNRVVVSSFHPFVIWRVKFLDKGIPTAYIWSNQLVPKILRKPWFINLVHPDMLNPEAHLVTENLVSYAHRKGMRLNVWTVNNYPAITWLLNIGVDGIISDYPHLMLKAVNSIKEK